MQEGSLIRVEPEAERAIAAGAKGMTYICIQAAKGSLKQYTLTDAAGVIAKHHGCKQVNSSCIWAFFC